MNKETLKQIYLEGGSSLVAKRFQCSIPTAYKLLKEAKIELDARKRKSGRKKKFKLENL